MKWILPLILILGSMVLAACSTVPLTGRKQLSLVPSSQMMSMSCQQYGGFGPCV